MHSTFSTKPSLPSNYLVHKMGHRLWRKFGYKFSRNSPSLLEKMEGKVHKQSLALPFRQRKLQSTMCMLISNCLVQSIAYNVFLNREKGESTLQRIQNHLISALFMEHTMSMLSEHETIHHSTVFHQKPIERRK